MKAIIGDYTFARENTPAGMYASHGVNGGSFKKRPGRHLGLYYPSGSYGFQFREAQAAWKNMTAGEKSLWLDLIANHYYPVRNPDYPRYIHGYQAFIGTYMQALSANEWRSRSGCQAYTIINGISYPWSMGDFMAVISPDYSPLADFHVWFYNSFGYVSDLISGFSCSRTSGTSLKISIDISIPLTSFPPGTDEVFVGTNQYGGSFKFYRSSRLYTNPRWSSWSWKHFFAVFPANSHFHLFADPGPFDSFQISLEWEEITASPLSEGYYNMTIYPINNNGWLNGRIDQLIYLS